MHTHLNFENSPPLRAATTEMANPSKHVTDSATFYTDLYTYYHAKGLINLLAKRVLSLCMTTFIVIYCSFLFSFVKWKELLGCTEGSGYHTSNYYNMRDQSGNATENTAREGCGPLSNYINWHVWKSPHGWHVMVIGNMLIMCIYWLWGILTMIPATWTALRIYNYLQNELNITTRQLQTMEWETLLERHVTQHKNINERGMMPPERADNYDELLENAHVVPQRLFSSVASIIMRTDNYMIAVVKENAIPLRICKYNIPFSHSLYWILRPIISGERPDRINGTHIRQTSIMLGVISLIVMPFAFIFLFTYYLIRHAEDFHTHKDYLGPRTWTLYAKNMFRNYNELPHHFYNRLVGSYNPATEYIRQFYLPVENTVAQFLSFIFSAVLTVMAGIALFDETIMLHVTIGSRNLLFYLAISSFGMALVRYFIPDPKTLPYTPQEKMNKLISHISNVPETWKTLAHTFEVRDDVMSHFHLRIHEIFNEMVAAVFLPYVLLVIVPKRAEDLARFIRTCTVSDEHGNVIMTASAEWDKLDV